MAILALTGSQVYTNTTRVPQVPVDPAGTTQPEESTHCEGRGQTSVDTQASPIYCYILLLF